MERKACFAFGKVEKTNRIIERDLVMQLNGINYVISVGTTEYFRDLEAHRIRENLAPPDKHEILIMDDVSSPEAICQTLSSMPIERLRPYLIEQEPPSLK